jgi:hypothetical protein
MTKKIIKIIFKVESIKTYKKLKEIAYLNDYKILFTDGWFEYMYGSFRNCYIYFYVNSKKVDISNLHMKGKSVYPEIFNINTIKKFEFVLKTKGITISYKPKKLIYD